MRDHPIRKAGPILLGGAATIAFAELAIFAFRNAQLFCPERAPLVSWNPSDYGIDPDAVQEVSFRSGRRSQLHGWYCRARDPVASVLLCHGNAGNLTTVADMLPPLLGAGLDLLTFDYRGYGRSSGRPTIDGVLDDARAAALLHDQIRPAGLPSVLYGYSLGGAVAAQLIVDHPFDGLILQSTFTTLADVARTVPSRLPLHHFAGDLFDTVSVVPRLRVPLLLIHGEKDEVVPASMSRTLYEAGQGPRSIHIVPDGVHGSLFANPKTSPIDAIVQFLASLSAVPRRTAVAPLPAGPSTLARARTLLAGLRRATKLASKSL